MDVFTITVKSAAFVLENSNEMKTLTEVEIIKCF